MAKRAQISLNPPDDVFKWFRGLEIETGLSKTRLGIAGFVALEFLGDVERNAVIQWANLVDEGHISWTDLQKEARKTEKKRAAALQRVVEAILRSELEEQPTKRPKRA